MNSRTLKITFCILAVFLPLSSANAQQRKLDQARIDEAVAAEMKRQNLVGVGIGLISDGEIAYCKGYGFANRKEEIAFTTETVTNWASNSKPVVAVAALQLVEKGLLSLSESVRTYLPELPLDYKEITIRHLLCHQSGYPHYSNGKIVRLKTDSLGANKMDPLYSLRRFGASPLIYKPGEKYSYSSYAYVILSAVVQRAGKQALMEQLDERILKPLKITSFELDVSYKDQKLWSVGYKRLGKAVEPPPIPSNAAHLTPWTKSNFLAVRRDHAADYQSWGREADEGRPDELLPVQSRMIRLKLTKAQSAKLEAAKPSDKGAFLMGYAQRHPWQGRPSGS